MNCPHCGLKIKLIEEHTNNWCDYRDEVVGDGSEIAYGHCPNCEKFICVFRRGTFQGYGGDISFYCTSEEIIFPKYALRNVAPEVPERYKIDFLEACAIQSLSPKSSAALSRRILQTVLREELKIRRRNLEKEIEEFINKPGTPTYLVERVDAVRNIGNFAAHPLKNTNTGEIVEVEAGEAEWLLEVNETLFDFVFVQPKRLAENKKNLNAKLESVGKPPMKG